MSIKNNFNYIKDELSNDGQLLENTLRLEMFYKKYKYVIYALIVLIFICGILYKFYSQYTEDNIQKNSAIYMKLTNDVDNVLLIDELKTNNSSLYDLFSLQQALKNGNIDQFIKLRDNKNPLISYISSYHIGSFDRDISTLKNINKSTLGDLSKLQQAYILINDNKINEAKILLGEIPRESNLNGLAKILSHYMITKK